jgi:hypothetical protein
MRKSRSSVEQIAFALEAGGDGHADRGGVSEDGRVCADVPSMEEEVRGNGRG